LSASSVSPARPARSYGSGARILSIGIASTGLLTFTYFALASHVLNGPQAKRIDLLWSVMFVIISVIYRPVEQLLSRSIAARRARGHVQHGLREPAAIQTAFALLFLAVALILRTPLTNGVFGHDSGLYWVLVAGTTAYAASYFARGWLAGHQFFGLYGGLVLMESVSRLCFALAVAVSLLHGELAVALGIAAAPFVSLVVVPWAYGRRAHSARELEDVDAALAGPGTEGVQEAVAADELSLRRGSHFAIVVASIMLAEQTLLNAAVLTIDATAVSASVAGIVFNVLLIARAPLQLFQAIQTSLLPHLTGLEATAGHAAFSRAVRTTVLAIAGFAALVAVGLLAVGPFAMAHVFGQPYAYNRFGLALVALGMGLHLVAGTLNQAALARDRARASAACWLTAAAVFVAWTLSPAISGPVLRTEVGYAGATALLAVLLTVLYRLSSPARAQVSSDSAIAR
jgi:O-antigen/teichoic acid export membrane protein